MTQEVTKETRSILDPLLMDEMFGREREKAPLEERRPDKKALKSAIKSEEGCEFASLGENWNLQIK